jgi:hypothetical protein
MASRWDWEKTRTDSEKVASPTYNQDEMRANILERRGRLEELDRSFDLKFWQAQSPQARFSAAWEMNIYATRIKGNDVRQLRLQRSVATFQRQPR